jgi:hypothetical protein
MRLVLTTDDGEIVEEWMGVEFYDLSTESAQLEVSRGLQNAIREYERNPLFI